MQQAVALKLTNDADGGVALKGDTGGAQKSEYSPTDFGRSNRSIGVTA